MAHSEQQTAVLELGKLLVKELGLDKGVDTLSRWMAHYIAEKITLVESLPAGTDKQKAEQECFEIILEVWSRRWQLRSNRQPLRNFRELLEILNRLDPRKSDPYFYHFNQENVTEIKDDSFDALELDKLNVIALQIDKVARIWIDYVLRKAAAKANNATIGKIVENAVMLPDPEDSIIVQIVTSEDMVDISAEKPFDMEKINHTYRIEELNRRIIELRKFKKLNEFLENEYKKELLGLENNTQNALPNKT